MGNKEMLEVLQKILENGDDQLYEQVWESFTKEMSQAEVIALEQDLNQIH